MIYGIGTDIVEVIRLKKWVETPSIIKRYFNPKEMLLNESASIQRKCEYYAVRFAAKESFAKALGTGLKGFSLADIYIEKDLEGKPLLRVTGNAKEILQARCGVNSLVFVSLSHEKKYALAHVVIERGEYGKK